MFSPILNEYVHGVVLLVVYPICLFIHAYIFFTYVYVLSFVYFTYFKINHFFFDAVSHNSRGYPGIHCVAQTSLKLRKVILPLPPRS